MRLMRAVIVSMLSVWMGLVCPLVPEAVGQSCVAVTTYHNDNLRTGQNLAETVLTPSSVGSLTQEFVTTGNFDSWAVTQPLYLPQATVTVKGVNSVHNLVFVTTLNNTVYAFDADSGKLGWKWHDSAGIPDAVPFDPGTGCVDSNFYSSPSGGAGIVGTPVIDTSISPPALYFVTKELDGGVHKLVLHALNTATGVEFSTPTGPIVLAGSVINHAGTTVPFNAGRKSEMEE